MRRRQVGRTGVEVGAIGLGCMGMSATYDIGGGRDERDLIDVIHHALDLGVTLLDTADVYGPFTNEELVGKALADGRRAQATLATKVGLVMKEGAAAEAGGNILDGEKFNGSPQHIRSAIDASLRRLRTDHVDLYQLHRVDPEVPLEESWGAMADAVAAGKARFLGLSEVSVQQIRRAQAIHPVASVQSEFSLWTRDALSEVVPYCAANGIAFLPWAPIGRGFLTGRFESFAELPQTDFRRHLPRFQPGSLEANLELVRRLRAIAERVEATAAQVALAWVLAQGSHVIPIPGTTRIGHLVENAAATHLKLSRAYLDELGALPQPVGERY